MSDLVGKQFGNYRLMRLLGQGGFAAVYLGEHVYLGSKTAVKVLAVPLAQEGAGDFVKEARTLAHLIHPHIIRLLDYGVETGTPFLVMDFAPGGTLRKRHPRGEVLPLPTVASYVHQVAEALQYAHDRRLVHRDVKPANLLLGRSGEVLLGDFGIAQLSQSSRTPAAAGSAGTITYMAPEQIQGAPRRASDQYALGVTVYEWLTGHPPFTGSFAEIAARHCYAPPPPLRASAAGIPGAVEQVVMRALSKLPEQRFSTMQAFASALELAAAGVLDETTQPVSASAPPGGGWRLEDDFEGRSS
jgi:serine/threonine protein kinase